MENLKDLCKLIVEIIDGYELRVDYESLGGRCNRKTIEFIKKEDEK